MEILFSQSECTTALSFSLSLSCRQKAFISSFYIIFSCASVCRWRKFCSVICDEFVCDTTIHIIGFFLVFYFWLNMLYFTMKNKKERKAQETKIGLWPKNLIRRKIFNLSFVFFRFCSFPFLTSVHDIRKRLRAFNLCVNLSKEFTTKHLNSFSSTFAILLTLTCNLNQHKLSHPLTISDFFILFLIPSSPFSPPLHNCSNFSFK